MNADVDYLSPPIIAKLCQVSPATVCNWCRKRGLKHHRLPTGKNRRWRILRADLVAWLRDNGMEYHAETIKQETPDPENQAAQIARKSPLYHFLSESGKADLVAAIEAGRQLGIREERERPTNAKTI